MSLDWKSLSVAEIEKRYNQAVYAPNAREVVQAYTDESRQVLSELDGERFQYGLKPSEYGYWFKPQATRQDMAASGDMVVFIHGGAWKDGTAEDYVFPAKWLAQQGLHYICLNFDNTPATGGRLFPMLN